MDNMHKTRSGASRKLLAFTDTAGGTIVHYTRESIQAHLMAADGTYLLILNPGDTAHDLETGDTLLGPSMWTVAYGQFPGPPVTMTLIGQ